MTRKSDNGHVRDKKMKLREALATTRGFRNMLLYWLSPILFVSGLFGAISIRGIYKFGPYEQFSLGPVAVPKFTGTGGSNLAVLLLSVTVIIACLCGVLLRYFQHRKTLEFLRPQGIHDFDGDSKIDSFEDGFLDDLYK